MMFRKLILILALPLVFSSAAIAESGDHYLKEGIVAFKEARYQDAVAYFSKAKENGMASSNVSYNLGASYYKMNQYREAKTAFMDAAKNKKFQKFSWYNLGLVERKLGNNEEAVKWFKKTLSAKGSVKVDALANQMIQRLSPKETTTESVPKVINSANKPSSSLNTTGDKFAALDLGLGYVDYVADLALDEKDKKRRKRRTSKSKRSRKIRGGIDLAYGYDDNLINADDQSTATNRSSDYTEVFAYVDIPLGQHFTFMGDILNQTIQDDSAINNLGDQDFSQTRIGIQYSTKLGGLKVIPSLSYAQSKFGNDDYLDILDFKVKLIKKLGKGKKFSFRFRHSDIDADTAFRQYDGDRQQYRFEYKMHTAFGKWRFRYQLEANDRTNSDTRDYSPTRHDFRARLKKKVFAGFVFSTEFQYRISNYDGTNAAIAAVPNVSPAFPAGFEREIDRTRFKLGLSKRINKSWKAGVSWAYTDSDSNINVDDYDKQVYQIYANWTF